MKKLSITLVALIGIMLLFVGSSFAANSEIVFGCLYDITGTYAAMSKMEKEAADMAVAKINSDGGLLGKKVKVIYEDGETKPEVATRKAERLILQENVDFLIAPVVSSSTLNIMEIAKKYNKILAVSISQSTKITTTNKNKQTFRFCANPNITADALCKYMVTKKGPNIYMLTVDYAWGRSTSEVYNESLKSLKANMLGETFFPLGTKDFASYFGKIKNAKPDVLFITAAGNDSISAVTQADQYGLKQLTQISGDGSLVAADVLGAMGKAANGIITADYYTSALDTPENIAWVAEYQKLYGEKPSKFSVSTYEAVMWMAQAVKKAGSTDTDKVISALEGSTYHGPQGKKKMDADSHQTSLDVYMLVAEDGELKPLKN
ncbi:MAG: ABC transporter substrate-binding protein [Desulfatirhabdiaceae bacterium]